MYVCVCVCVCVSYLLSLTVSLPSLSVAAVPKRCMGFLSPCAAFVLPPFLKLPVG